MMLKALKIPLFLLAFAVALNAAAQCGTVISSFPYNEGFESAPAWTSGGTNSDWAWGAPTHPLISSAGGGSKCWTVGGLSGSFYNYSEQSWIMSPCFDFTTLNYPWISFKIFWEDEWKYDGLVLQYSLNSGSTWANIGAFGDATNCLNDNWYNYSNVSWLTTASPKHGWTGRTGPTSGSCQGGNGSLTWVTAKHCMSALAGEPNVRFRFYFGSGTTCNSYDGISIDDILISDAPPNAAGFTYTCTGSSTITFTNTSIFCPTGYLWNFGDGYSAISQNATHTYAAPGTYNVTLTASGPCNAPSTITIPVTIVGVSTTVTNINCNGANNGTATANITGGSALTYNWAPSGGSAATATGLAAGTYTVTVSAAGGCSTTATATITQPPALTASTAVTPVTCFGAADGTATVTAAGGTTPYSYSWSGGMGTAAILSGLAAGTYTVTVTDQNNCSTTASAMVTQPAAAVSLSAVNTPVSCFGGSNGSITTTASGGTMPYSYSWNPAVSTSGSTAALAAGSYTIYVSDQHGCTSSATTTVTQPASALTANASSHPSSCGLPNGSASALANGGTAPYTYSWSSPANETTTSITGLSPGTYTVTVHDANGCSVAPTTTVTDSGAVAVFIISTPVTCYGTPTGSVSAEMTGGTAPYSYQWQSGQTASHLNNIAAGNYCVSVTDANGCHDSTCIDLPQPPPVNAAFTFDPAIAELDDPLIHFTDQTFNSVYWNWNFGDLATATTNNPVHAYTAEGTYPVTLVVTNAQGCTDSVTHDIIINDGFTFFAPNAFTPNGNGNNDVFLPKGNEWDAVTYNLWIFDRWGNMVFYTTDPAKGWDGQTKSSSENDLVDVYVWKVQLKDLRGNLKRYIGSVTLVH